MPPKCREKLLKIFAQTLREILEETGKSKKKKLEKNFTRSSKNDCGQPISRNSGRPSISSSVPAGTLPQVLPWIPSWKPFRNPSCNPEDNSFQNLSRKFSRRSSRDFHRNISRDFIQRFSWDFFKASPEVSKVSSLNSSRVHLGSSAGVPVGIYFTCVSLLGISIRTFAWIFNFRQLNSFFAHLWSIFWRQPFFRHFPKATCEAYFWSCCRNFSLCLLVHELVH